MRGRLIFRFYATIAPLDTDGINDAGNFDRTFRTVKKVDTDGDGIGETQRLEKAQISVPCQVEDKAFVERNQSTLGNVPDHDMILVFHFKDLERLGLVDADGTPQIRLDDRLVNIKDRHGNVVQTVKTPPGQYVVAVTPLSFGLGISNPKRNICIAMFKAKDDGSSRA